MTAILRRSTQSDRAYPSASLSSSTIYPSPRSQTAPRATCRIHFIQTHIFVWISPGVLRVSGDILRGANRIEDLLLRWQRCGKKKGSDQNQRDLPQPLGAKWTEHSYPFGWHVGRGRVMLRH